MSEEEKRKKHAEYQRKRYHDMSNEKKREFLKHRKEVMSKYRKNHKEQFREYQKNYRKRLIDEGKVNKSKQMIIEELQQEKENLIKYLESEIKFINNNNLDIAILNLRLNDSQMSTYITLIGILEKVKSGRYE